MIAAGAIEEVSNQGGERALSNTAEKAIGVREIRSFLADEISKDELLAAIQQATRRYAKRQQTWFKRESGFKSICLSREDDASSVTDRILSQFPHIQSK